MKNMLIFCVLCILSHISLTGNVEAKTTDASWELVKFCNKCKDKK